MKTLAPELSALMIILRSTGPRDLHAAVEQDPPGSGAYVQSPLRTGRGLGEEVRLAGIEAFLALLRGGQGVIFHARPERPDEGRSRSRAASVRMRSGRSLDATC